MKAMFRGLLAIALLCAGVCEAAPGDKILISTQKKSAPAVRGKVGEDGSIAKDSQKAHYEVKLENQTLADLSQLTVNYVIFIERPKVGARMDQPSQVDRVSGSQAVDVVTIRAPQTVTTTEFELYKENVVGGYTYDNGGRVRAEDTVAGIWVRIVQNGEQIAEYANPPSVIKRGWDDPRGGKKGKPAK